MARDVTLRNPALKNQKERKKENKKPQRECTAAYRLYSQTSTQIHAATYVETERQTEMSWDFYENIRIGYRTL